MIFILTGPVDSGKTTFLKRVIAELKKQKIKMDGFLSEAIMKDQEKIGYDLVDLGDGKPVPFIRKSGRQDWQRIGPYFFIPKGLSWAKKIILRSRKEEILVVDEIGPLELSGQGLWDVLEQVIFQGVQKCLFVLRREILEDFLKMVGKIEIRIFDIKEEDVFPRLLEEIKTLPS
jgi:nucleoside-triphosphatase THEP1